MLQVGYWDPEKVREHNRKRYADNPGERVAYNRRRKYGLAPETYDAMRAQQVGLCAICGDPPGKKSLAVDHCHKTGKVRELLCIRCNTTLGGIERFPDSLARFAAYLAKHSN